MNKCPYNNKTGQMVDRSIKFKILCEPELPLGQRTCDLASLVPCVLGVMGRVSDCRAQRF
jgi:hypothetical protein